MNATKDINRHIVGYLFSSTDDFVDEVLKRAIEVDIVYKDKKMSLFAAAVQDTHLVSDLFWDTFWDTICNVAADYLDLDIHIDEDAKQQPSYYTWVDADKNSEELIEKCHTFETWTLCPLSVRIDE